MSGVPLRFTYCLLAAVLLTSGVIRISTSQELGTGQTIPPDLQTARAEQEKKMELARTPEEKIEATSALARLLTRYSVEAQEPTDLLMEAASLYGSVLDLIPDDQPSQIFNDYGVVLLRLGQHEEAASVFQRFADAIRSGSLDAEAAIYFYNYGRAEELSGRLQNASSLYQKALELNSRFGPAQDAILRLVHDELPPVDASRAVLALAEYLAERGALTDLERHVNLSFQNERNSYLETYQESAMFVLDFYLAAAKVSIEDYTSHWMGYLHTLDWQWGKRAASHRDWLQIVYARDFEMPAFESTTLDIFGEDSRIAADLLKVVGDDYVLGEQFMKARKRYELAWAVAGQVETALDLAYLVYRKPEVVDPDGQLRSSLFKQLESEVASRGGWSAERDLHVIFGDIAEEEGNRKQSIYHRESALWAHDRLYTGLRGTRGPEPVPILHERLARDYESENQIQAAIDHYLEAAMGYRELGHVGAEHIAMNRAEFLSVDPPNELPDVLQDEVAYDPQGEREPSEIALADFVTVPGTAVIKKVVAASDNIHALSFAGGDDEAFKLEVLKPYFVLAENDGWIKVTDQQASGGRVGFVTSRQVIEWNSREGLHFQPSVLSFDERPEVKVWKDRATIEQYANTGNVKTYGPSYAEEMLISRALPKELIPYPILDSALIPTVTGAHKRVYRALIPAYVPTTTVVTNLSPDEIRLVLSSVTFCVIFDATGSMEPYANEMAATIETLLRSLGAQAASVRVGFVFFRDTEDPNPVEVFSPAPIDIAVKVLREISGRMAGGGDAAEPVLDAAVVAADEFEWAGGGQAGSRKAAIIVLNGDAKSTTVGLDGRVGRGLDASEVAHLLSTKHIRAFALQAGAGDGGHLAATLSTLASQTGGEYYAYGADSSGLSRSFSSNVKSLMEGTTVGASEEAHAVGDNAIPDGLGFTVLPLKVLDSELISRLQESAREFNITEGGLVIREGWMFEQEDLYQEQLLVEKETLKQLISFFTLLSDSSVSCDDLRSGVRENLRAMLGEEIDDRAELQELIEKKLGIQFRTTLMSFSLEYLCGLSPRERLHLQERITEAGGKLGNFLEVASVVLNKKPQVWMKLSYLP